MAKFLYIPISFLSPNNQIYMTAMFLRFDNVVQRIRRRLPLTPIQKIKIQVHLEVIKNMSAGLTNILLIPYVSQSYKLYYLCLER